MKTEASYVLYFTARDRSSKLQCTTDALRRLAQSIAQLPDQVSSYVG